jgi:hypothetical protein
MKLPKFGGWHLFSQRVARRQLLGSAGLGIGAVALASLLRRDAAAGVTPADGGTPGLPGLPHHPPTAKRVVMLWQGGGPSHVDLFDPKPALIRRGGEDIPESVRGATRLSTMSSGYAKWPVVAPIKGFKKYGKSGIEMSEMLPGIGSIADEICLVRSMNTEAVNHAPGVTFFMTGAQVPGRPSMGAWMSYGLGCDTDELPAFVVMTSSDKEQVLRPALLRLTTGAAASCRAGIQGVRFRNTGDPVPYLANPAGVSRESRRALLDDIAAMNAASTWPTTAIRRSTRGSRSMRWPTGCRRACPTSSIFPTSPSTCSTATGPTCTTKGTLRLQLPDRAAAA